MLTQTCHSEDLLANSPPSVLKLLMSFLSVLPMTEHRRLGHGGRLKCVSAPKLMNLTNDLFLLHIMYHCLLGHNSMLAM